MSTPSRKDAVLRHYEQLLAPIYTWMIGGLPSAVSANAEFFARHGVVPPPAKPARALDVGAGPGPQALCLANLGYAVTAIDPSETLIAELRRAAGEQGLAIDAVVDAVPLDKRHCGPFALVTCMTDTLVSLPDVATARTLVHEAAERLSPQGRLVLTWRDLTRIPEHDARFFPVRSDERRILACFVENIDDTHVRVHDLLFERCGHGFSQKVSSYLKLRLSAETVDQWLIEAGLVIDTRTVHRGMQARVARRPA